MNMNFAESIVVKTTDLDWIDSPAAGVERKPLERESAESGHTTSIVKYKPGAKFATHEHPRGEEVFVLEGVFSDENGDYSAGTYLRNPPGSSHAPFSKDGCIIFVKLNQFQENDKEEIRVNTLESTWYQGQGNLKVMPLHEFVGHNTALVKWPAGEKFLPHKHFGGEEILVLSGTFKDEHGTYPARTWIRNAHLSQHHPYVEEETVILVKTGHIKKGETYEI